MIEEIISQVFSSAEYHRVLEITSQVFSDPYQQIAIYVIASVFLLSLLLGVRAERGFFAALASNAPTILISLGILFTFFGIVLALWEFDVKNINTAIPPFLDGLKLAFVSSLVGIAAAVLFRLIAPFFQKEEKESVSATDVLHALNQIKDALVGEGEASLSTQMSKLRNEFRDFANKVAEKESFSASDILQALNQIKDALVGEADASLSTQISKLRNDFRDFANKVAEDGSANLVKALEAVIADFNAKINEQFGDNFKQLNEAVAALLEWQKQYKDQVEQLTEAFENAQQGIQAVRESVTEIATSTQKIPEQMASVQDAFDATQVRLVQLHEGLESLAAMRKQAENAVPYIQQQITEMTTNIQNTITNQMETMTAMTTALQQAQDRWDAQVQQQMKTMTTMTTALQQAQDRWDAQVQQQVEKAINSVGGALVSITENFVETCESSVIEMTTNIQDTITNQKETMTTMTTALQQAQDRWDAQVQQRINDMGNALASITGKFVETYEESYEKLTKEYESSVKQSIDNLSRVRRRE